MIQKVGPKLEIILKSWPLHSIGKITYKSCTRMCCHICCGADPHFSNNTSTKLRRLWSSHGIYQNPWPDPWLDFDKPWLGQRKGKIGFMIRIAISWLLRPIQINFARGEWYLDICVDTCKRQTTKDKRQKTTDRRQNTKDKRPTTDSRAPFGRAARA